MFLAAGWPSALGKSLYDQKYRYLYIGALILILVASILLECRAAWLGVVISSMILLVSRYRIISRIKESKLKTGVVISTIILITSIYLITSLYTFKQKSADNRLIIWKNTIHLISNQPLMGYGYGLFEKNYNLNSDNSHTGFVRMAHNEVLQTAVEGGLVGVILLSGFFILVVSSGISFLRLKISDHISINDHKFQVLTALAGICSFLIMSMVNFTIQAVPVMCLIIIYCGIAIARADIKISNRIMYLNFPKLVVLLASVFVVCFFAFQVTVIQAELISKKAKDILVKDPNTALNMLEPLKEKLSAHEAFWQNYGRALMNTERYKNAVEAFSTALQFSSNPEILYYKGQCFENLDLHNEARKAYGQALSIEPSRLKPHFFLMNSYLRTKSIADANREAQIILKKPQSRNQIAEVYKMHAKKVLENNSQL